MSYCDISVFNGRWGWDYIEKELINDWTKKTLLENYLESRHIRR